MTPLSVLIIEVSLFQSVFIKEVPLYIHVHVHVHCTMYVYSTCRCCQLFYPSIKAKKCWTLTLVHRSVKSYFTQACTVACITSLMHLLFYTYMYEHLPRLCMQSIFTCYFVTNCIIDMFILIVICQCYIKCMTIFLYLSLNYFSIFL